MICILLLLLSLSLILFLYNKREGLDNCNSPPIKGSTAGEITNSSEITSLKKQINNLDTSLREQVATNTGKINNITSNIKGLGDLRQIVVGLSDTIKKTEKGIQNIKQQIQKQ